MSINVAHKKFLENVQIDLRNLSNEAKKKYPAFRESCDEAAGKVSEGLSRGDADLYTLSAHVLGALLHGCRVKEAKIVKQCLGTVQRLIVQRAVTADGADQIVTTAWTLMRAGVEQVKLLQTVTLLLTSSSVARADTLAKALALCFRLCFCRDSTVMNTAVATVWQIVALVFERVVTEMTETPPEQRQKPEACDHLKIAGPSAPATLNPAAADAFLLFQDLVQLVNGEQPFWLTGLTEMTRTFGLDLIESVLLSFSDVFFRHWEFTFLLKEHVCAMAIRLFSPNVKCRGTGGGAVSSPGGGGGHERPYFPTTLRLMRVIGVLIQKYFSLLVMESEIFLSLLVKLLDRDRPYWQRGLTLELLHQLCNNRRLVVSLCASYDMRPQSTKVFQEIIGALDGYIHYLFSQSFAPSAGYGDANVLHSGSSGASAASATAAAVPIFCIGHVWIPLSVAMSSGTAKYPFLEMKERIEAPTMPEGYGLSLAYACIQDLIDGVHSAVHQSASSGGAASLLLTPLPGELAVSVSDSASSASLVDSLLVRQLVLSSCSGLLSAVSLLLQASLDDGITEALLRSLLLLTQCYGAARATCGTDTGTISDTAAAAGAAGAGGAAQQQQQQKQQLLQLSYLREMCVATMCRAALPPHYQLAAVADVSRQVAPTAPSSVEPAITSPATAASCAVDSTDLSSSSSPPVATAAGGSVTSPAAAAAADPNSRQQVVAVGAALATASLAPAAHQVVVMLTAKNLQCVRSLMRLATDQGAILEKCWHMVLMTLQHVVWVLGLKSSNYTPSSVSPSAAGVHQSSSSSSLATTAAVSSSSSSGGGVGSAGGGGGGGAGGNSVAAAPAAVDGGASATVLTTAVLTDLPALCQQLQAVLAASRQLDDVSLHHVIDSLGRLNDEVMQLPVTSREPSLFAVAALLSVGLANGERIGVCWRPVTGHLLDACRHQHARMRQTATDALASLVQSALLTHCSLDQRLETLVLRTLLELTSGGHWEVRQRQLQCALRVLQACGERLRAGWPLLLDIVAAIDDKHTEQLVRLAFQCLQLIVTDLLPVLPGHCLLACVNTVALFGAQKHELNIALTAIGFMWNISDYFYQNCDRLTASLAAETCSVPDFPGVDTLSPFDRLWLCLFSRIGDLCVDSRPAVRKSAGQTLFSTVSAHGALLATPTWNSVLCQVLFPLLERVQTACNTASTDKVDDTNSILIHHTRNTAHKQWAETQVLVLLGAARVFQCRHSVLLQLPQFLQSWTLLLQFIRQAAIGSNSEVSLAALKALQDLVDAERSDTQCSESDDGDSGGGGGEGSGSGGDSGGGGGEGGSSGGGGVEHSSPSQHWLNAWQAWLDIGVGVTSASQFDIQAPNSNGLAATTTTTKTTTADITDTGTMPVPSQTFLTTLVQTFPALFAHLRGSFSSGQFERLCALLYACLSVPVCGDGAYSVPVTAVAGVAGGSGGDSAALSPLQEAVLVALHTVTKYVLRTGGDCDMLCLIFEQLFRLIALGCRPVRCSSFKAPPNPAGAYVAFVESLLHRSLQLYQLTFSHTSVIEGHVLTKLVQCLELPLSMKYTCPAQSVWRLAVTVLLSALRHGLPVLRQYRQHAAGLWSQLPVSLDTLLFCRNKPPEAYAADQFSADESLDCAVVQLIRDHILPLHALVPSRFLIAVMLLLNKGSLHSDDCLSPASGAAPMREQFATACFDTLLHSSLRMSLPSAAAASSTPPPAAAAAAAPAAGATAAGGGDVSSQLAVTALVHRFHEVISRFLTDSVETGQCPLPRHRMAEMCFVLRAIKSVLQSIRSNDAKPVDAVTWQQLVQLYKPLVECTLLPGDTIGPSLCQCLLEFGSFLQPIVAPTGNSNNKNNNTH